MPWCAPLAVPAEMAVVPYDIGALGYTAAEAIIHMDARAYEFELSYDNSAWLGRRIRVCLLHDALVVFLGETFIVIESFAQLRVVLAADRSNTLFVSFVPDEQVLVLVDTIRAASTLGLPSILRDKLVALDPTHLYQQNPLIEELLVATMDFIARYPFSVYQGALLRATVTRCSCVPRFAAAITQSIVDMCHSLRHPREPLCLDPGSPPRTYTVPECPPAPGRKTTPRRSLAAVVPRRLVNSIVEEALLGDV